MQFTLVMTASVQVNGRVGLAMVDTAERERQYEDVLKFYANSCGVTNILFVENSGWSLVKLQESVKNSAAKVSFLSLDENNYPPEYGKGYGEFLIMDRAIDAIARLGLPQQIVKVTGRFPILNLEQMLDEFNRYAGCDIQADIVDHPIYDICQFWRKPERRWSGHHGRTILYWITSDYYRRNFYGRYRELTHYGQSGAEHLMWEVFQTSCRHREQNTRWRFHTEPSLGGRAGGVSNSWIDFSYYGGGGTF